MQRPLSLVMLFVALGLFLAIGIPCGIAALALYLVLYPVRYLVDRAHEKEVAELDASGYDPSCCSSEEFSAYANVNGALLNLLAMLPLLPIAPPGMILAGSWKWVQHSWYPT